MEYEILISDSGKYVIFRVKGAMTVELGRAAGPDRASPARRDRVADARPARRRVAPGW